MGDIIKEMRNQVPHGLFRLNIFLPADVTVLPMYLRITIEAVLLFAFI